MQALLYCDLGKKSVSERPGGGAFTWPKLVQGDDVRIALRFTERVNDTATEVQRTLDTLRVTLGRDDARPESGAFALKIGSATSEVGVNVTAALAYGELVTVTKGYLFGDEVEDEQLPAGLIAAGMLLGAAGYVQRRKTTVQG